MSVSHTCNSRSLLVAVLSASLLAGSAIAAVATDDVAQPLGSHPWQFLGKGPDGYDNGERHDCTGTGAPSPAVLCVLAGAAPGGNGSLATPFASINAAIAAALAGDIIQVAAGNYAENVAVGAFGAAIDKPLTLLGGFSPDFSVRDAGLNVSVIDGGGVGPGVQLHVVSDLTTTLDGFEITGGLGLGSDWSDGNGSGAGVFVEQYGNGETLISHNHIHGNQTAHFGDSARGGGIHTQAQDWDGALAMVRIEDNYVRNNEAGRGGGIDITGREALVLRNRIEANLGHSDHGGGLYVSTPTANVRDNAILSNEIGVTVGYGWGGGALIAGEGITAAFQGNVYTDNYAPSIGSGIFWDEGAVGTMKNELLFRNRCTQDDRQGTAIYVDGGAAPSMVDAENITVADHLCANTSATGGAIHLEADSGITLRNSILWGNTREFGSDGSATSNAVEYSITAEAGTGNFLQDPRFANPAGDDYHLRSTGGRFTPGGWIADAQHSPAIDAGDPVSDYSLETSPNGGRINLGAYGNTAEASRSVGGDGIFTNGFESGT